MPIAVVTALLLGGATPPAASRWFGTWQLRLSAPDDRPETLVYSDAGGGAMRMESVEDRSVLVTRFDGRPAADARGDALAITATSPTRYRWIGYRAGRPFVQGVNTLAADGRTFREVSWRIGEPGRTRTFVYERR